jgi:hypothetical protein
VEAALAYDAAARIYRGSGSKLKLNFPDGPPPGYEDCLTSQPDNDPFIRRPGRGSSPERKRKRRVKRREAEEGEQVREEVIIIFIITTTIAIFIINPSSPPMWSFPSTDQLTVMPPCPSPAPATRRPRAPHEPLPRHVVQQKYREVARADPRAGEGGREPGLLLQPHRGGAGV